MTEQTFAQKTLEKLLEVVAVEFKIPLGVAEIKFPATEVAKNWWESKKSRLEIEDAIRRAEQAFIAANPENTLAQILHSFPLHSDEEYRTVILELLKHLDEDRITWLAQIKIERAWNQQISRKDIRRALELYISFLRHELNGIREFREIIAARMLERIEENTNETVRGISRIETKLDRVLDSRGTKEQPNYWYIPHPYPMPPNFTGRKAELKMLEGWLVDDRDRLFILRALGGFGKSALTWQWICNHVNPAQWKRLVWWSFYEGDASFENFVKSSLKYLHIEVPQGQRPQVDELLKAMQREKILLIIDGFERALRAYSSMNAAYQGDEEPRLENNQLDCVNINAEWFLKGVCSLPKIKSKLLMTTRLTPRTVKPRGEIMLGCHEEELTSMSKEDAVDFFRKQGIKGTHAEIEAACALYGYHPLSLRLLAGRILKDFENPADIVVAQRLKIDGDIIQQKHHVLEISYNSLPPHEQKILGTIACFRSPVEFTALQYTAENKNTLVNDLHDLTERGLLHFDENNKRFDLHPIVRHYAYEHLTGTDRFDTHDLIYHYFDAIPKPQKIYRLEDLTPVIEIYHHLLQRGGIIEARRLYDSRIRRVLYFQLGVYELIIELLQSLLGAQEEIPEKPEQDVAWTLNELGKAYGMNGEPVHAIELLKRSLRIRKKLNHKTEEAKILSNLGNRLVDIGNLKNALSVLKSAEKLCIDAENEFLEAVIHRQLGRVMSCCGMWDNAPVEFSKSREIFTTLRADQPQSALNSYLAHHELLLKRDLNSPKASFFSPIHYALFSLDIDQRVAISRHPYRRDNIRTHWILGASYLIEDKPADAERYLNQALIMCRGSNNVEIEARILIELAHLHCYQQNYEEAKSLAEEALTITERCSYVLQGADVNLFLAQYALEQEKDKTKAKEYAETALKLAYCDGPPYYYKVAYEEAERMLRKLG